MKSLNKRSDFEHFWEKTFSEAEMEPSENVWDRIDANLSREEAGKFKKRVFMYKLLTAASIAFALGIGAFSLNYYLRNENTGDIASTPAQAETGTVTSNQPQEQQVIAPSTKQQLVIDDNAKVASNSQTTAGINNTIISSSPFIDTEAIINNIVSDQGLSSVPNLMDSRSTAVAELFPRGLQPAVKDAELLAMVPEHIYMIPIMPRGSSKRVSKEDDLNFIAGLDFSTGLFDPGFGQSDGSALNLGGNYAAMAKTENFNDQLASFNTVNKDFQSVRNSGKETSPAVSYSYGANMGFKVARRILLQSGLSYRKSNSTTTATAYIEEVGSGQRMPVVASYNYKLEGLSAVNSMAETSLTNQYEFASIPIRAGYIILEKKINLTLLAGVSSEIFHGNTISGGGNLLSEITEKQGESSPYKDVYFNGSLGTMIGYAFSDKYHVSIEPGYRFAMNSFTKDDFYLNSFPSSFMVSFGVAYNFK